MAGRTDRRRALRVKMEGYLNLVRIHREIEQRAVTLLTEAGFAGMTLAQATALLVLVQEQSSLTAARLAGLLNVSAVTVGRFVRSLEQGRWIHRKPDPNDARAMLLSPTRKTLDCMMQFFAVTDQLMDDAYAGIELPLIEDMVACLARVRANLYTASGKSDIEPQVTV